MAELTREQVEKKRDEAQQYLKATDGQWTSNRRYPMNVVALAEGWLEQNSELEALRLKCASLESEAVHLHAENERRERQMKALQRRLKSKVARVVQLEAVKEAADKLLMASGRKSGIPSDACAAEFFALAAACAKADEAEDHRNRTEA